MGKDYSVGRTGKIRVLFVGGFKEVALDGSVGGQILACRTLIESPISNHVEWHLLDTTQRSVPPASVPVRFVAAAQRLILFLKHIWHDSPDATLIFSSFGTSLLEKGLMAILAKHSGVGVVFAPRSGLVLRAMQRSLSWRKCVRLILRYSDCVMCQSESWKRVYAQVSGLPSSRFVVIRNWIDSRDYSTLAEPPAPPPVRVLYMGWFEPYKGVYDLVEAISRKRGGLAGTRVTMCGKGAEFEGVQRRIRELGLHEQIELPGWVTGRQKMEQIQKAHIFVLPSHHEGFPNALLEAMAAGKAVVATAVGGVPELLTSPLLGRLVQPRNVDALGNAIVECVADPEFRRVLGRNARAHVLENHEIGRVWPRVLEMLISVTKNPGKEAINSHHRHSTALQ